jgi:hypothetical protein
MGQASDWLVNQLPADAHPTICTANSTSPPLLGGAHMPTTSIRDSSKPESLSLGIQCHGLECDIMATYFSLWGSNVAGGISSRSSIARAVEVLFPFKCLRDQVVECLQMTTICTIMPFVNNNNVCVANPCVAGYGWLWFTQSVLCFNNYKKEEANYKIESRLQYNRELFIIEEQKL